MKERLLFSFCRNRTCTELLHNGAILRRGHLKLSGCKLNLHPAAHAHRLHEACPCCHVQIGCPGCKSRCVRADHKACSHNMGKAQLPAGWPKVSQVIEHKPEGLLRIAALDGLSSIQARTQPICQPRLLTQHRVHLQLQPAAAVRPQHICSGLADWQDCMQVAAEGGMQCGFVPACPLRRPAVVLCSCLSNLQGQCNLILHKKPFERLIVDFLTHHQAGCLCLSLCCAVPSSQQADWGKCASSISVSMEFLLHIKKIGNYSRAC